MSIIFRSLAAMLLALNIGIGLASAQQAAVPAQAVAAPLAAPVAAPVTALPVQPITLADGYVLGVGDAVQVAVLGRAEFNVRVQVQTDGTIQLPYLQSVQARDKTVLQLRDDVKQRLKAGGYYTDPAVEVAVVGVTSRYVTVLGEVGQPGLLPIDRTYRVSEVLARVGGTRATSDDQVLLRRVSGEEIRLNITDVASGGPDADPIVNPGDKIFVATAPSFYIYGQISAPGSYKVERGMTLRQALARGGGLTERGSDKKVKLFRNGQQMDRVPLSEPIRGGDTVVIGERVF